jgi:hypothetical protein
MPAKIVPLEMTASQALRLVREIAAETENIVIVPHGQKRARQRKFTRRQIELCLQRGSVTEGPYTGQSGLWRLNMFRHAAGEELTCVVEIDLPNRLIVVTVF